MLGTSAVWQRRRDTYGPRFGKSYARSLRATVHTQHFQRPWQVRNLGGHWGSVGHFGRVPCVLNTQKETGLFSFLPVPTATMLIIPAPWQGWLHVIEAFGRIETNVQAIKTGVKFPLKFLIYVQHKVLCIEYVTYILNTVFNVFYLAVLGEIGYTFFVCILSEEVVCEVCQKTFKRKDYLKQHMKTHTEERSVCRCPREGCGRTYTTVFNLQSHILSFHEERRPFVCEHAGCGKTFAMKVRAHPPRDSPIGVSFPAGFHGALGPRTVCPGPAGRVSGALRPPSCFSCSGLERKAAAQPDLDVPRGSESSPGWGAQHPLETC